MKTLGKFTAVIATLVSNAREERVGSATALRRYSIMKASVGIQVGDPSDKYNRNKYPAPN